MVLWHASLRNGRGSPPFCEERHNVRKDPACTIDSSWKPVSAAAANATALERDPRLRLGSGLSGSQNVKNAAFFESMDWDALERKRYSTMAPIS